MSRSHVLKGTLPFASIAMLTAQLLLAPQAGAQRAAAAAPSGAAQPPAGAQPAPTVAGVKSGFLVRPDTVEVGDPFVLIVSVVVPNGARVEWPSITDTAAAVAMRAPVRVQSVPDGISRRETAEYQLSAWDVGALPLGLPDATVRIGTAALRVPLGEAAVFVRTVLPGDTTLHVPKPAKALFPRVLPWWERWWPAFAVLAALLLLWWILKRRRKAVVARHAVPLDVYARAIKDFERLDRLALSDAGERGRAVALAVEILRVYLMSRVPAAALSLTSGELLEATAEDGRVPQDRLRSLLAEGDAIKFARQLVQSQRAKELTADAQTIVESVEAVHQARIAAAEAARQHAAQAERSARQTDEDDARRRSRRSKAGAG
jgi:hypothetical protein